MNTINEILHYCNQKNPIGALMLTGKWGCGKTYLIEHKLTEVSEFKEKFCMIRISLYGEDSLERIHKRIRQEYLLRVIGVRKERKKRDLKQQEEAMKSIKNVVGSIPRVPNVAKTIFSISPSDFVNVAPKIGNKELVLVFDDLERNNLSEFEVLGCINEYCENRKIKTIIVANEEKLKDTGEQESRYQEIKEKTIARTIFYQPDYQEVIAGIIDSYVGNGDYKKVLRDNKESIYKAFLETKIYNIRSLLCALQEFERIYYITKEKVGEFDFSGLLATFIVLVLKYKEGGLKKNQDYGWLFATDQLVKDFPECVNRRYILGGILEWITEGMWQQDRIEKELARLSETECRIVPEYVVCNSYIFDIDEDIMEQGFPLAIEEAYKGRISLNEYVQLLLNIAEARSIGLVLPVEVEYSKFKKGLEILYQKMVDEVEEKPNYSLVIGKETYEGLLSEEKEIYDRIEEVRDFYYLEHDVNRKKYILALRSKDKETLFRLENGAFREFDKDMAYAVMDYYADLDNSERRRFAMDFSSKWLKRDIHSYSNVQKCKEAFSILLGLLRELAESMEKEKHAIKRSIDLDFQKKLCEYLQEECREE